VDFDYLRLEDGATIFVVAEESSIVHAYIADDLSNESGFLSAIGKLPPGSNILSASIGPMRITNSTNFAALVAVAVFD
jgi:hypothetical protein